MAKRTEADIKAGSVSKLYELMLILNSDLRESEVTKKLKEIEGIIEKADGKITENDFWGKRKMAYRIKKCKEGIYTVYNFSLPSSFVKELKEFLRIEKSVLRYMLINLPDGYVYTKYDLLKDTEEKFTKKFAEKSANIANIKKKPQVYLKEEKTDHSVKEGETSHGRSAAEEKNREAELDKKLDEILGGEDIKL